MTEKTETDKKMMKSTNTNADEMIMRDEKTAVKSDMKIEERDR